MKYVGQYTKEISFPIGGIGTGSIGLGGDGRLIDWEIFNRPSKGSVIKAETKQKILGVARQYGYREYISTRPDKIVGQIGIVVFNLNNEYFSELITEIEYVLREEGLGAVIMMSHYNGQYEIECIRNLYNMGVKGIILCSVNNGVEFQNYLKLFPNKQIQYTLHIY